MVCLHSLVCVYFEFSVFFLRSGNQLKKKLNQKKREKRKLKLLRVVICGLVIYVRQQINSKENFDSKIQSRSYYVQSMSANGSSDHGIEYEFVLVRIG